MNMKKVLALLLSGTMLFSVSACGSANDEAKGQKKEETKKVSAEAEEEGEIDYYGFAEETPIKVGFAWGEDFEFTGGDSTENNPWMDLYREHNIKPEILYEVDSSQAETKLSTAIMSGNYPDIFQIPRNEYEKYIDSGVIMEISELLEKYATPELKEYLNADGGLSMEALQTENGLYGLPKMDNAYDFVNLMFIRKDWLDNLDLEVPQTMDDLKRVAHAFTHEDPDGNGKDDTYGLALDGVNVLTDSIGTATGIFEGFGAYPDSMKFVEKDGEVVWGGSLAEEMKNALTLLQEMYADGSVTADFITMDSNSIFEEGGSGRCGIFFGPMWGAMTSSYNALNQDPNAFFVSARIPDGTGKGENKPLISHSFENIFAVSSQCEHPEVLIKLMNLSVQKLCHPESPEEFNTYYGNGSYAVYKASLTPTLVPLKNYDNYLKESAALVSGDTSELNTEQLGDYENMKAYLEAVESGNIDPDDGVFQGGCGLYTVFGNPEGSYAALDKIIKEDAFMYTAYNALPTPKMAEVEATLNKLTVETIVKIITGDPVESYDDFLDSWNKLGGADVTAEATEWVKNVDK